MKDDEFAGWTPRAGDWVEVRSVDEIMRTLDERGDFERMPFMPEMLRFAGQRFQISAVAHKTCDTVNKTGGRAVKDAVHLADLRCDGSAHGGCQAACLLFWKTAWLRKAPGQRHLDPATASDGCPAGGRDVGKLALNAATARSDGVTVYRCQATTLPHWSRPLKWWDVRQYWRDVRSGNATLRHASATLLLAAIYKLRRLPRGYRLTRWLYEQTHLRLRGFPDPHGRGVIPAGEKTPDARLDLLPGELVEIKTKSEILETLNYQNRNRGLWIDEEELRYCGGQFRVARRVTQIINEQTCEMTRFTNPCIVLEGVYCRGDYSDKRLLCPRRITAYWREIWLRRPEGSGATGQQY